MKIAPAREDRIGIPYLGGYGLCWGLCFPRPLLERSYDDLSRACILYFFSVFSLFFLSCCVSTSKKAGSIAYAFRSARISWREANTRGVIVEGGGGGEGRGRIDVVFALIFVIICFGGERELSFFFVFLL